MGWRVLTAGGEVKVMVNVYKAARENFKEGVDNQKCNDDGKYSDGGNHGNDGVHSVDDGKNCGDDLHGAAREVSGCSEVNGRKRVEEGGHAMHVRRWGRLTLHRGSSGCRIRACC